MAIIHDESKHLGSLVLLALVLLRVLSQTTLITDAYTHKGMVFAPLLALFGKTGSADA